jgi:hypothetical protein
MIRDLTAQNAKGRKERKVFEWKIYGFIWESGET